MECNKQRAFAVEALGDDDEVVGVEDFTRAHDGIQGAEARVVEHDVGRIDACGNQILPHRHRFVIALQGVIAAQQQVVHLAAVIGVQRALNAVAIILVDHPGAVIFGGAEHHAHLAIGQVLQVIKDVGGGFPAHPAVETQHDKQQYADQDRQAVKNAL